MSTFVIVGAGHAAGQATASLRQEGHDGAIVVLGDEPYAPYQRPPLSKQYLSGEQEVKNLYLRQPEYFTRQNIDLRTGVAVVSIDPEQKTVTTQAGENIWFDKLLLATGSRPRRLAIPGADRQGVHYLRTIEDVDEIRKALRTASRVCIIGAGYIGLEVASVVAKAGHQVTVLETEERVLQRVTSAEMSAFYHDLHGAHGVDIRVNSRALELAGTGHVEAVVCADQRIDTDLVVIGIGILPNVELAEAAGLQCDNGVVVDEHCRASHADIYAAGDCTNHPNPILMRRLRLESVPNAMEQARVAAANMLGGDRTYAEVPWFWSDQYGLKLQMVGFSADGEQQVVRGDKSAHHFAVFYLKDDTIVGVDAVNSPKEFMMGRKLYGKKVDPAVLAHPDTDLKSLL